jgi:tRNA (cytidine/uridine-2'-O-)-methyltransferase
MALNIVLFQPQIPQNTGNIARTCAALKAVLHLVHPLGFSINEKSVKRAGLDYWTLLDIREYSSTAQFFERNKDKEFWFFTTKGRTIYTDVNYSEDTFLIFGSETKGIDESILFEHPASCLRLPMREESRSLNLSNSVAVAAFEFERQQNYQSLLKKGELHNLKWPKTQN